MYAERGRLTLALLLSLLIHALLLSLTFDGQGLGLPGFGFPWRERRIEAPDLHVVLVPARVAALEPASTLVKAPLKQVSIEQTVTRGPALTPSLSTAPIADRAIQAIVLKSDVNAETNATAQATPEPDIATAAVPANAPMRTEVSGDAAPATIPELTVIAVERSNDPTFVVPLPPPAPTPVIAVVPSAAVAPGTETVTPAPRDASEGAQKRAEPEVRERAAEVAKINPSEREAQTLQQRQADQLEAAQVEAAQQEAARQEAARIEAARLEAVRLETRRQEAARLATSQVEAQRQEAARQEAARIEAARLEAVRLENRRQEAARLATSQVEAQRQEAARQEAARIEAAQLEAARLETQRQEAARLAASQVEAARIQEEKEEDARRIARRQAMGRQLNEEAARREAAETAARSSSTLPFSLSTARRGRLWGRSDSNAELVQYAEAWARKIHFNTPVDTVREVVKLPHTKPMVTVAIRSDGSVESVTFVISSGVAEVDEAIRRIVQSHLPNPAFPPRLAHEFDVIEVRRTWHFDTAIRLY